MTKNRSFYNHILREYEQKRNASRRDFESRREAVYKAIPKIREIDGQMETLGIQAAKAVLQKPENMNSIVSQLKENNAKMDALKDKLLEENNYHPSYLEQKFNCDLCKDTGYTGTVMCKCFRQRLIEHAYDMSNMKDILNIENFDNFDIRYYSKEEIASEGMCPQENMKRILNRCLKFTSQFDKETNNLFLYGKSGLGKTFLCHCIAKELLDKGKTVLYITAFQLFRLVEQIKFNRNEIDGEQEEYLESVLDCDLLIIDDLGTEFTTILSSSELFNIINTRMLEKRPLIISTNLSPTDLISQYSDRIVSRIQGNFVVLKFFGEDIRIIKKYGMKR